MTGIADGLAPRRTTSAWAAGVGWRARSDLRFRWAAAVLSSSAPGELVDAVTSSRRRCLVGAIAADDSENNPLRQRDWRSDDPVVIDDAGSRHR